jgi:hypothetical protein
VSAAANEPVDAAPPPAGKVATVVVALVFAVLYGYALLQAISNLVELPSVLALHDIADSTPWPLLIVGVAIPPVLYVVALLIGRRRPLSSRALLLAAGLGATNALGLSLATLVPALLPAFSS